MEVEAEAEAEVVEEVAEEKGLPLVLEAEAEAGKAVVEVEKGV